MRSAYHSGPGDRPIITRLNIKNIIRQIIQIPLNQTKRNATCIFYVESGDNGISVPAALDEFGSFGTPLPDSEGQRMDPTGTHRVMSLTKLQRLE